MRRILAFGMTAVVITALSVSSFANTRTPRINKRQENQHDRIRQGVRSGELTRGEADRLRAQEARIQAEKLRAKSDGHVGPHERAHIEHQLNRTNREIFHRKHNGRVR